MLLPAHLLTVATPHAALGPPPAAEVEAAARDAMLAQCHALLSLDDPGGRPGCPLLAPLSCSCCVGAGGAAGGDKCAGLQPCGHSNSMRACRQHAVCLPQALHPPPPPNPPTQPGLQSACPTTRSLTCCQPWAAPSEDHQRSHTRCRQRWRRRRRRLPRLAAPAAPAPACRQSQCSWPPCCRPWAWRQPRAAATSAPPTGQHLPLRRSRGDRLRRWHCRTRL